MSLIEESASHITHIKALVDQMVENRKNANCIENDREKAIVYHDTVMPMLDDIRHYIDQLELIVDNEMWTLPKYREMLFIR
jgi:glutamine synthetase